MVKDEMINYGAQIIAQTLSKTDVIKFNDIGLRKMSQIIEDMNKGVMEALYNEDYRKVGEDEIVIKKREYEQLKKHNRDRKRLRLRWQQAKQETREILQVLKDNIVNRIGSKYAVIDLTDIAQRAKELGIELED